MSAWLKQVFAAGQVAKGNIVRRKKTSVARYSSMKDLIAEVKKRDFHMVETGDQVIIICNKGNVQIVV
jgi:hypothetical protein